MITTAPHEREKGLRTTGPPRESRPLFPLSPVDLERWQRFASKGGIGKARAKVDRVSQDGGQKDLMFLAGEQIVILLDLGDFTFLGCCEGVVGLLYGSDVDMCQSNLKKPVMTTRPKRPPALQLSAPNTDPTEIDTGQLPSPSARSRAVYPASLQDWASLASSASLNSTSPAFSQSEASRRASAHSPFVAVDDAADAVLQNLLVPADSLSAASSGPRFVQAEAISTISQPQQACSVKRPPSHVLSPSGMPVPSPHEPRRSAFSFSPNSSIASSIPTSIFSAGDLALRRSAGRDSNAIDQSFGDESGPSTPGDDPTLAFIFDSYKYSEAPFEAVHTTTQVDHVVPLSAPVLSRERVEDDASAPPGVPSRARSNSEAISVGAGSGGHDVTPAFAPTYHTPRLNKLRRPRLKSSPASRPSLPTSVAAPSPRKAATRPLRATSLPRSSIMSTSSNPSRPRRSVDYSTRISNRDFAGETVQIGKSEFEIVKPLASLLLGQDPSSAEIKTLAASPTEFTASSPREAQMAVATFPPPSLVTPKPTRSTASVSSHFSPPTPPSAEVGGRTGLANYRAREVKWLTILSTPSEARNIRKLRQLVVADIPSSLRGKVWTFLTRPPEPLPKGLFRQLAEADTPLPYEAEQELQAIIDASDAELGLAGRQDLEDVLRAFRLFRPALGYYPGLGRVASDLLGQMPVQAAFETVISLVDGYRFRAFFPSQRTQLELEMLTFRCLLERVEGKLAKRLREWGIEPQDYLPAWLSTLFYGILTDSSRLRAIDFLLLHRNDFYAIPLALLDLSNLGDKITFPSRDAALNHLLAPPRDAFNLDLLVQAIASTKVTDDKISKAREKAERAILDSP